MHHQFDVIVIGTGSAGKTVAYACNDGGLGVAIVDSRPFGGTCTLRGCDPKKVLVGAAEVLDWQRRMTGRGVVAPDAHIDWAELMRFKRSFTEPVPEETERSLADAGITAFHGRARFVNATALRVDDETLRARHVVIASGAKPRALNIPGETYLTTSTGFLDLDELPERIVFVGGGYISFEFAHLAVRAGARATILHRSARALKEFDDEMVDYLVAATRDAGIDVHFETPVTGIERKNGEFVVHTPRTGETSAADLVVHGAGRVPEIDDLDLDAANVERNPRGIVVNEYLQSVSNPAVYAAGDAAAEGPELTPVAGAQARVVAANLLNGNVRRFDATGIPSVVFTVPPLTAVGLSEAAARKRGLDVEVKHGESSMWFSAERTNEEHTAFKTVIERGSRRVVGAHLLGQHAEEVINLFALAIRHGLSADALADTIYTYPTKSSDMLYMV